VRVRTDVAALTKTFDYSVPPRWDDAVRLGTRVRVALHGRRVGGWVVADHVEPPAGVTPVPLAHLSGWGPPPALLDLAQWAAWRWAGPESFFLRTASPEHAVHALPPAPTPHQAPPVWSPTPLMTLVERETRSEIPSVLLRLAPSVDLLDVVLGVITATRARRVRGTVLVLVPSVGWAERLTGRLVRRGCAATHSWAEARAGWPVVVGNRAGSWAPVPELAAAVVLDAHDEAYREESAPTYSAVEVVAERARRCGALCVLTSPVPPATLRAHRREVALPPRSERDGWPAVEVVDRRGADPRTGLFSEEMVRLALQVLGPEGTARPGEPLVCVYNRTGGARLSACTRCGTVAQCEVCTAAVQVREERFSCPRCGSVRPAVCERCGGLRMKTLRAGVSRLREELSALLRTEVGEVSGPQRAQPDTDPVSPARTARALVGTEAVLHRIRRAAAVVFLDVDLHLLAPRASASDESLAMLARAARLLGPRQGRPPTARMVLQTRVPDHVVVAAVAQGDPARALAEDEGFRRSAGLPPFSALALLSGPLAGEFAQGVRSRGEARDVRVSELAEGRYLVSAGDHPSLCDVLADVERPSGRGLRVEVDPAAV